MDNAEVIDKFIGVYLLYSLNDKYIGKTYIGYTVDPNRRINQHNKGMDCGGAKKTNNKGPWKMILIVHGFPNNISGLRFEWAWQNPQSSRRLQHVVSKRKIRKETDLNYRLRILSEMLQVGPWKRLPLTIRWLETEYSQDFPPDKLPPFHMPICYGPIKSNKTMSKMSTDSNEINEKIYSCNLCYKIIEEADSKITCLNHKCDFVSHIICLADIFLKEDEYIPVEGECPSCRIKLLWGNLIRKMEGCNDMKESGSRSPEFYNNDSSDSF